MRALCTGYTIDYTSCLTVNSSSVNFYTIIWLFGLNNFCLFDKWTCWTFTKITLFTTFSHHQVFLIVCWKACLVDMLIFFYDILLQVFFKEFFAWSSHFLSVGLKKLSLSEFKLNFCKCVLRYLFAQNCLKTVLFSTQTTKYSVHKFTVESTK